MVTASTYRKEHLFASPKRLALVRDTLFALAKELGWELQAWAVMPNHYHFIALSEGQPETLRILVRRLHSLTARAVNAEEGRPGRRVWFQYWDTRLTFQESYLARLKYVHLNPVHHGLTKRAEEYPWCSARWFAVTAEAPFFKTVQSFRVDRLNVPDVECGGLPPLFRAPGGPKGEQVARGNQGSRRPPPNA
jgi:putative transposase